ncbi:MAG TPA: tetratricopeptide repeat protein, partial [Terriglobia bacterium]|nr:tetratricopeptide repeat protein [Terriglobia bacterium]
MLLGLAATSLPAQQTPADRVIQSLQLHAKMYPQDPAGYDRLGAAYLQKGRETGDASYYELAKKALDKSLELESDGPDAASATAHMAIVYMAQHRFDQALTWAENALALGSGDLSPWAIVVDALTDMGEYGKALEYCSRLETPAGSAAGRDWSYERNSRLSYLKFISGDTRSATELMRSAIRAATANQMPRENIAWSQYQLGDECYRTGDLAGAESAFQDSLATYPGYYRALAGLAAVRAAQKRYPESIELYQRAVAVIPDPIFVAALGDAYAKVGRPAEAQTEYDLVEFIGRLSEINKVLYNRDLAIFYADHDRKLQEAVDLARKELEVRRDVYTWDALAWALYKSGRASEAREPMEKALRPGLKTSPENRPESSSTTGLAGPTGLTGVTAGRAAGATTGPETGPQDVMLFFHAGMIYDRLGETAKARDYLDRALSADPNFHPFYAEVAG